MRRMPDRAALARQRPLLLVLAGQIVSTFGDAFFNVAILWVVYAQSASIFQTALTQIVWHLTDILLGPLFCSSTATPTLFAQCQDVSVAA